MRHVRISSRNPYILQSGSTVARALARLFRTCNVYTRARGDSGYAHATDEAITKCSYVTILAETRTEVHRSRKNFARNAKRFVVADYLATKRLGLR